MMIAVALFIGLVVGMMFRTKIQKISMVDTKPLDEIVGGHIILTASCFFIGVIIHLAMM